MGIQGVKIRRRTTVKHSRRTTIALQKRINRENLAGWTTFYIIQHSQTNVLIFILQIAILICTMGLWTFGAGYLILFEKESDDPERDIEGESDTRSIRDKGTMARLAAQFAGMSYSAAPPISLGMHSFQSHTEKPKGTHGAPLRPVAGFLHRDRFDD